LFRRTLAVSRGGREFCQLHLALPRRARPASAARRGSAASWTCP